MSLMAHYDAAIAAGTHHDDIFQRDALKALQCVADALNTPRHFWFRRRLKKGIKGLYLYGTVGVGKTYLMDLFYQQVTERHKMRIHFHQFMQQIDGQLRLLQGHSNPLKSIADKMSKTTHLLCLDEFLVQDIATAMVLTELFRHLLANGVVLVATSNTSPDNLYHNGLQRIRFLPTIALIKEHCTVHHLTESCDYRLGHTARPKAYLFPLNEATELSMSQQFEACQTSLNLEPLVIQGRTIETVQQSDTAVWFKFDVICNLPRSQLDYLEIAHRFQTVLVSGIPELTVNDTVGALLLTHLVDVLYDERVRLICSAAVPIASLYRHGEWKKSFQRTQSRLEEMQSIAYENHR